MGKDIGDWHKFTSLIVSQVSSRQYMQLCVQCSLMTVPFPSLYASPRLFHSKKKRRWTRYVHLDGNRTDGDEEELGDLIESIESTVTIQSASPHFPCFPSFSLFAHHIARQESVDLFLFMYFIFFSFQIEKSSSRDFIFLFEDRATRFEGTKLKVSPVCPTRNRRGREMGFSIRGKSIGKVRGNRIRTRLSLLAASPL